MDNQDEYLFAVCSLRDYGDGEIYFSTDAICPTRDMAVAFIRKGIKETCEQYADVDSDPRIDPESDDYSEFRVDVAGFYFLWRIDYIRVRADDCREAH